uniref:TIL domain-containing protein n=1 Tax=Steinernema glaseri TaxID=37863 RepID=A0A1I7YU42_9BILA
MRSFFVVLALALALVSAQSLEEKQCGKNEYFSTSTCNICDPPCSNPGHYVCPLICYPPKCMCKEGFCRDSNNRCVTPPQTLRMFSSLRNVEQLKKIPQTKEEPKCGQNEHFSASACNACDPTCFGRGRPAICPAMCYPPKCMCNKGFYRDPMNRCVAPQQCPLMLPYF